MKKLIGILMIGVLTSCSVNTSGDINVDTDDLTYVKDDRTGLCFAMVASRKSFDTDATGLGLTCVPCKEVEKYLKK
jgi:sugar/nucleoside kinase (ribokinase family)